MSEEQNNLEDAKKKVNTFAKYSALGIQFGAIVGFFAWLGNFLDKKQENDTPVWTIVFCLLGVGGGLYLMLKDLIKNSK